MKPAATLRRPKTSIWERAMDFEKELSPAAARALLQVRFASSQHKRMSALLQKARERKLTPEEQEQLDTYELLGSFLGILHSKARQVLKQRAPDA